MTTETVTAQPELVESGDRRCRVCRKVHGCYKNHPWAPAGPNRGEYKLWGDLTDGHAYDKEDWPDHVAWREQEARNVGYREGRLAVWQELAEIVEENTEVASRVLGGSR